MPFFTYFFCWSPDGNGGFAGGCVWCKMKKMIPETPKSDPLEARLRNAWRRERHSIHLSGLLRVVALAVPLFFFLFVLDRMLDLPRGARWGLLILATGAVGWQVFKHWFSRLRPYDGLTWASRVEQVFPHLNSLLLPRSTLRPPRRLVRKSCLVSSKPKRWMRSVQLIFARRSTTASCARLSNGPALLWLGFSCCSCLSEIP